MDKQRMLGRARRLLDARKKLLARLQAQPKHRLAKTWRAKIAEYDRSLANIQKFGQENQPTDGNTGVEIDVELGTISLAVKTPGA